MDATIDQQQCNDVMASLLGRCSRRSLRRWRNQRSHRSRRSKSRSRRSRKSRRNIRSRRSWRSRRMSNRRTRSRRSRRSRRSKTSSRRSLAYPYCSPGAADCFLLKKAFWDCKLLAILPATLFSIAQKMIKIIQTRFCGTIKFSKRPGCPQKSGRLLATLPDCWYLGSNSKLFRSGRLH